MSYHFLRIDTRDGKNCHFWFDNWMEKGRLIDISGATVTTYLGVLRHGRVSDAVKSEGWSIRGQRNQRFHELHRSIMAISPTKPKNGTDIVLWKHGDKDYQPTFSASRTWDQLRVKGSECHGVKWSGSHKESLIFPSSLG